MTTLGMREEEMEEIASIVADLLSHAEPLVDQDTHKPSQGRARVPPKNLQRAKERVAALLERFPLYPEISIE